MSALPVTARVLLLLALGAAPSCERPESSLFGHPPSHRPLRLVALPGAVSEGTGEDAASASLETVDDLLLWRGEEVSAWRAEQNADAIRYTSPPLGKHGLARAGRLRVRLRPGGATRVVVVPRARGAQVAREQRALRSVELELERDAKPNVAVDLDVDLREVLHGNFGDAGRGGLLEEVEIELPGARPGAAELLEVAIARYSVVPSGASVGSGVVEHDGVLRPAWFVRGGASVELEVEVPAAHPELRWHDAALSGTGPRVIQVVDARERTLLAREPAADDAPAPWRVRSVALDDFAGQRIRLRLAVEGAGTGLFGNPRVTSRATAERAKDVLVYMIDTLRADRLGAGGNAAPAVSPTIDRLARDGAWLDLAQSSSPWTKPAIATLMSGILPTTHGVGARTYTDRMPETVALVQERFRDAGWRTASFAASPLGSTLSALERGFDAAYPPRFWTAPSLEANPAADQLHQALLAWVGEEPDAPFFAYVHTLEVHEWKLERYRPKRPEGTAYDAAIHDADRHLGDLLDALARAGRTDNLLVVVVSDHGESWGDHGLPSHGFGLYQSQIHIPMIFWQAAGGLSRVRSPASLADLAPTLLDGFGLAPLDEADGVSLVDALAGGEPEPRGVLSALLRFVWAPNAPKQYALTTSERTKVIRVEGERPRAFDLVLDPRETQPADSSNENLRRLDHLLAVQQERAAAFRRNHGAPRPGAVTLDDVERLRALGYLEEQDDTRDP